MQEYKVQLETFSGPLDLLLYLIRRNEVDIFDIPIARITEQYLHYLDLMSELNINVAGEFLVMAATLMEIKSRMMAPQPEPGEEDEEAEDPRMELVRQLMEYKRFKEAALALAERAKEMSTRFGRPGERPEPSQAVEPAAVGVSIWALLDAFTRVLEQTGAGPHTIVIDDIPQERLRADLEAFVREKGSVEFFDVFTTRRDRSILVGMFLALLELVRLQVIRVRQEETFGPIWLTYVPPEERGAAEPVESLHEEGAD